MARSINDIKQIMTDKFIAEPAIITAYDLDVNKTFEEQFSTISIESIIFYIVAFCIHTIEIFFDVFKNDTQNNIKELKPHSTRWYATKALAYQHGFNLIDDTDTYDNTGYTDDQIAASKIVKYAACVKQQNQFGRVYLRIKLAGESGIDLSPLSLAQVAGVKAYFDEIEDAGVKLQIESLPADRAKMKWEIYYDPLILDNNGSRLDGTASDVVRTAIKGYFKNLPFNGVYVLAYHTDYVQSVEGITIPVITEAKTKYGLLNYSDVQVKVTPDAGYLRFYDEADLEIVYIAQAQIL